MKTRCTVIYPAGKVSFFFELGGLSALLFIPSSIWSLAPPPPANCGLALAGAKGEGRALPLSPPSSEGTGLAWGGSVPS
jgi:hypothetical protein